MKEFLERLSSPISGTFIVSFMFTNWQLFFLFVDKKMSYSEKVNEVFLLASWQKFLFIPLIFCTLYLFGMPWLLIQFKKFQNFIEILNSREDFKKEAIKENEKTFGKMYSLELNASSLLLLKKQLDQLEILKVNLDENAKAFIHQNGRISHSFNESSSIVSKIISEINIGIESSELIKKNLPHILSFKVDRLEVLWSKLESALKSIAKLKKSKALNLE